MSDNINFRNLCNLWREEKSSLVKRSTMAVYNLILETHLLPYFGDMTRIGEDEVQKFVFNKLKSGLSQKSVKDMLMILKMIMKYGSRHYSFEYKGWDIKYPTEDTVVKLPVLTLEHQKKLMAYLRENLTLRNLGVLICLHTGLRIGEICALKWGDLDLDAGVIHITKTLERIYVVEGEKRYSEVIVNTPKTRKSLREIPVTTELWKIIKEMKPEGQDNHYVLTGREKPVEPRSYRNHYKRLLNNLGIPELKFHGLRHSFATRCIESQCDYKTVSVLLGHSDISTTLNLYVHPNMEQKKRCIDRMMKSLE